MRLTLALLRAIQLENHILSEASARREARTGPEEARREAALPSCGWTGDGEMRALVGILRNRYMRSHGR